MKGIVFSALRWGLIGGLIIAILQIVLILINPMYIGGGWGILVYLPLLFIMIYGGISLRKENGGEIKFTQALLGVFIIAIIGSLIYNITVFRLWMSLVDPDYMDNLLRLVESKIRNEGDSKGYTDEQIELQIEYLHKVNFESLNYLVSAVCSVILSLIVSAFVSRRDNRNIKEVV